MAREPKGSRDVLKLEMVDALSEQLGVRRDYAGAIADVLVPVAEDFMMRAMMAVVEARKGK